VHGVHDVLPVGSAKFSVYKKNWPDTGACGRKIKRKKEKKKGEIINPSSHRLPHFFRPSPSLS
jgi:hypothetical protein